MPFTPSHAAAALLLRRASRTLPLAALSLGTMSPDFEYLLRLAPRGRFGHSPEGLLLFCLPLSLVAWLLYLRLIRPALRELLPPGLAAAVGPSGPARVAPAAAAVLLGALSHVVWDAFTHRGGFGVRVLPVLLTPAVPGVAWYKALQHGSTLAGAAVLGLAAVRWLRSHPPEVFRYVPGQAVRSARAVLALAAAAGLAGAANGARAAGSGLANVLGFSAVGVMTGLACALLAFGVVARARRSR